VTNAAPGGPAPAGNVQFKTNGVALGDPVALDSSGVAALIINSLPYGSNTVSAEYAGDSNFLGLTNKVVQIVNNPSPSIVVPPAYDSGSGTFSVTFAGIPNYTYSIQWAPSPMGPWTFLKTAAAGTDGLFEVTDTPSPQVSERYYRTVYP
jgi:hypothetical protein